MIPVLYDPAEQEFDNNGIGGLSDAISLTVTEELNGAFDAQMQIPVTAKYFPQIGLRSIFTARASAGKAPQPFRVYRMTKPINGIVTVYGHHIAYDLAGIVANPFTAPTVDLALQGLAGNASTTCPFVFTTDKTTLANFALTHPAPIWTMLAGVQGSILDTYGGEYRFNRMGVELLNRRGADHGMQIRYGKNMTDYQQDANCSNVYTGVYPYWSDTNGENLLALDPPIINAIGTYDYTRILSLDLSSEFQERPDEAALRARAERYMAENDIGIPSVSWKVSFEMLEQSEEYAAVTQFERVELGDTVHVYFPAMGVTASARAVKTEYDALAERYKTVTLGRVKSNIADTIAAQSKEIERLPDATVTQQISSGLMQAMLGINGGAVRLLDTNADGLPDTLYIADDPDPALAQKVWRWNYEGWAASSTGYSGEFVMGATLSDGILANAVTAANLTAGRIQSADGQTFYLDLDNGVLNMDVTNLLLRGGNLSDVLSVTQDADGHLVVRLGAAGATVASVIDNEHYRFVAPNDDTLGTLSPAEINFPVQDIFSMKNFAIQNFPSGAVGFVEPVNPD